MDHSLPFDSCESSAVYAVLLNTAHTDQLASTAHQHLVPCAPILWPGARISVPIELEVELGTRGYAETRTFPEGSPECSQNTIRQPTIVRSKSLGTLSTPRALRYFSGELRARQKHAAW